MKPNCLWRVCLITALVASLVHLKAPAADWPMFGRDATRNPVCPEKDPPADWNVGKIDRENGRWIQDGARIVKWVARLGSITCGDPVVADGLVWVGTNNEKLWEDFDREQDASVLACFRASDGQLLYEYVSPRMPRAYKQDWPFSSMAGSPLVEGDRLWFVTNRWETVCLDIGPLKRGEGEPRIVWKCDMTKELGVFPRGGEMNTTRHCSAAAYKDRIFVVTGNGVDSSSWEVPAPKAPSLVCFQKESGEVMWQDNSPGANILNGQWTSPLVVEVNGRAQVITPQGDGWVRSFDAMTGELIWKFDMNFKESKWHLDHSKCTRNNILATPVFYDNRVYLASGQQDTRGDGPGRLCCIDPTREGDVSSELAVDHNGNQITQRRVQAVDPAKGEKAVPNPNSGLIWEYTQLDQDGNGRINFEETFNRTLCSVAIKDGLLVAVDYRGLVYCFDAKTGQRYWSYDTFGSIYSPPLIVDDKVFVADNDGEVAVFNLSADPNTAMEEADGIPEPVNTVSMGNSVYVSPVFANGTLYIATAHHLFAIEEEKPQDDRGLGNWPQWRGPNRHNVSQETGLLDHWPEGGPPLVWRVEGLGQGIASVSVADGRIYTSTYNDGKELVVSLDQRSGKLVWAKAVGEAVQENPLMRWLTQRTPTIDDDRLYLLTAEGELICLATNDGKERWRKNYARDFGSKRGWWGFCDYPLVDRERLICAPIGEDATMVALNKITGDTIWKCSVDAAEGRNWDISYAATLGMEVGGIRQYVNFLNGSLAGIAAKDGRLLWQRPVSTRYFTLTPLIAGDRLFYAGAGPLTLLQLIPAGEHISAIEVYTGANAYLNPFQDHLIRVGDHVFACGWTLGGDRRERRVRRNRLNGLMRIALADGQPVWQQAEANAGATIYADGHLYLRSSTGLVTLVEASPDKYIEKGRFQVPDHQSASGATTPVIAGGHLYLRDDDKLFAYDIRQGTTGAPRPASTTVTLNLAAKRSSVAERDNEPTDRPGPRSVFVPTPQDVVEVMLAAANVKQEDLVYDLGSGDGRIVITAAKKYGCRAVGYEIDPELVELSRAKAREERVDDLVRSEKADIFNVDLTEADVIALYLLPEQLEKLVPQLQKLKPGARIVSHQFEIPGMKAEKTLEVESASDGEKHTVYLYPWKTPVTNSK